MKGEHHSVHTSRGYFSILSAVFPEQTKSTACIIVWSIIFLLELILGVLGAFHFGILAYDSITKGKIILLIAAIAVLFWIQGFLWGLLMKLFKK